MSNLNYKPAIDGLRAIAVLSVIIYHFDNNLISGGFIGVDLFFVISGYIITSVIYPQMQINNFSFVDFYSKRIKRILPLFYLVSFSSLVLAYIYYTPNDLSSFADSLRYSSSFIANIYFEKQSGYFAATSETMPLLHTWSLSIEEQFYFIWPVLLLLSSKYLSKKLFLAIVTTVVITLALYSEYLATNNTSQAYYWIQSRGFELLIGALLSVYLQNKTMPSMPKLVFNILGYIGLVTIFLSFLLLSKESLFPGINAFIVTVAVSLIIFSTETNKKGVYLLLSHPALLKIGKLSYSLYLWHWPILAFYRYQNNDFGLKGWLICGVATIVLSILSWTFFEKPLRFKKVKTRTVYVLYFLLPLIISVATAKFIAKQEGFPGRYSNETLQIYTTAAYTFDEEKKSLPQTQLYPPFEPYIIGEPSGLKVSAFIWGDSHAGHFRSFVDELGKKYHFSALFGGLGGCPPLIGVNLLKYNKPEKECSLYNNEALTKIINSDVSLVFLAARWAMYSETTRSPGERGSRVFLGEKGDYQENVETSRKYLKEGLDNSISQLLQNNKTVVLFTQVPSYPFKPSNCLLKKSKEKNTDISNCNLPYSKIESRFSYAVSMVNDLQKKHPKLITIDLSSIICPDNQCLSQIDGIPLYHDNGHLNDNGPRVLALKYLETKQSRRLINKLSEIKFESTKYNEK